MIGKGRRGLGGEMKAGSYLWEKGGVVECVDVFVED